MSVSAAHAFEDAATGFALKPVAGVTVAPVTSSRLDVGVGIVPDSGFPPIAGTGAHVCQAGFKAAPQNAKLTQSEIDAIVAGPERAKVMRGLVGILFEVTALRRIRRDGALGFGVEARPRLGPDHENVRAWMTMHETPKGRVTMICATTKAAWCKALPFFRRVGAALVLPR